MENNELLGQLQEQILELEDKISETKKKIEEYKKQINCYQEIIDDNEEVQKEIENLNSRVNYLEMDMNILYKQYQQAKKDENIINEPEKNPDAYINTCKSLKLDINLEKHQPKEYKKHIFKQFLFDLFFYWDDVMVGTPMVDGESYIPPHWVFKEKLKSLVLAIIAGVLTQNIFIGAAVFAGSFLVFRFVVVPIIWNIYFGSLEKLEKAYLLPENKAKASEKIKKHIHSLQTQYMSKKSDHSNLSLKLSKLKKVNEELLITKDAKERLEKLCAEEMEKLIDYEKKITVYKNRENQTQEILDDWEYYKEDNSKPKIKCIKK